MCQKSIQNTNRTFCVKVPCQDCNKVVCIQNIYFDQSVWWFTCLNCYGCDKKKYIEAEGCIAKDQAEYMNKRLKAIRKLWRRAQMAKIYLSATKYVANAMYLQIKHALEGKDSAYWEAKKEKEENAFSNNKT